MKGIDLKVGDWFVVMPANEENKGSRIFQKTANGIAVLVSYHNGKSDVQPVDAWPGINKEIEDLENRRVIKISLSPNALPYF